MQFSFKVLFWNERASEEPWLILDAGRATQLAERGAGLLFRPGPFVDLGREALSVPKTAGHGWPNVSCRLIAVPRRLWAALSQTLCLCLDMHSLGQGNVCICEGGGEGEREEEGRERDHSILELEVTLESSNPTSFQFFLFFFKGLKRILISWCCMTASFLRKTPTASGTNQTWYTDKKCTA